MPKAEKGGVWSKVDQSVWTSILDQHIMKMQAQRYLNIANLLMSFLFLNLKSIKSRVESTSDYFLFKHRLVNL